MALTCPRCGADNLETAKFCKSCGQGLTAIGGLKPPPPTAPPAPVACPSCGIPNAAGAKFCKACGSSLSAPPPPPPPESDTKPPTTVVDLGKTGDKKPRDTELPPLPEEPAKAGSLLPLIIFVVGLLLLAFAAYWFLMRSPDAPATAVTPASPASSAVSATTPAAGDAAKEATDSATSATQAEPSAPAAGTVRLVGPDSGGTSAGSAPAAATSEKPLISTSPATPAPVAAAVPAVTAEPAAQAAVTAPAKPAAVAPVTPVAKPVTRPAEKAPEKPPVLKFTPVDAATARNLPPSPGMPNQVTAQQQASPQASQNVQQAIPAVAASSHSSPEEACGKRVFLAMALCMTRQCETPQFTSHPQCVKLRQQNKDRQDQMNQGR